MMKLFGITALVLSIICMLGGFLGLLAANNSMGAWAVAAGFIGTLSSCVVVVLDDIRTLLIDIAGYLAPKEAEQLAKEDALR
jgi:hypothetical protein